MLTETELKEYRIRGHVTVASVFSPQLISDVLQDLQVWSEETLAQMTEDQRQWFTEPAGSATVLRKLDNPVFHRPVFRQLAFVPALVACVEQIIGPGTGVFFSQVFCKAPGVGGPKPVHQDNFYFGPDDTDGMVTVWIALDDATEKNGCLFYADGSHRGIIYDHFAPDSEPFNLQISNQHLADYVMTPAPVPSGGVSFHHGNTWHQSSANTSDKPRRAVAMHFLRNDVTLTKPALKYDVSVYVATPNP